MPVLPGEPVRPLGETVSPPAGALAELAVPVGALAVFVVAGGEVEGEDDEEEDAEGEPAGSDGLDDGFGGFDDVDGRGVGFVDVGDAGPLGVPGVALGLPWTPVGRSDGVPVAFGVGSSAVP